MCGIAGIINFKGQLNPSALRASVTRMATSMIHRGPDDSGCWVDPTNYCAFSHRRLSIIDTSSAGQQPMLSSDGRCSITFNGEIYNYLELREELEARGVKFRTATDTEVLIEMLRAYGTDALPMLDGMYAFAFFDLQSREVIVARDPFGEKPLFYTKQNGCFAFSSELHALSVLPDFNAEISRDAIAQYLAFQYVPAPLSIYERCFKLPPGHFLRLGSDGEISTRAHFTFNPHPNPDRAQPMDELADELDEILKASIKRRMISDVPLGAFLSGGVDSSAVVALMTKGLGRNVKTFSLGCHDSPESEHVYAREMAHHLGTDHHELVIVPDVPRLVRIIGANLDEPNADSSCIPTYLLSHFSRKQVTVLLSGDGGDEMFGGYSRYFETLAEEEQHLSGDPALASWNAANAYFTSRIMIFEESDLDRIMGGVPEITRESFLRYKARLNDPQLPLLSRLRKADMATYMAGAVLAKVDRMSMQHALEVRCPLLNIAIARFAEKLATSHCYRRGQGKLVLKEVASRYIPRPWLERRKMGFGVPVHLWNRRDLLKTMENLLLGRGSVIQNWLPRKSLAEFIERQTGGYFSAYQVWSLLILEIWLRHHQLAASEIDFERHPDGKLSSRLDSFLRFSRSGQRLGNAIGYGQLY